MRKGEHLPTILSSLFLKSLDQCLVANNCLYFNIDLNTADVDFSYVQLLPLLHADATSLVWESKQGLQKALDVLHNYCLDWKLEDNENQTKVMVFNGR